MDSRSIEEILDVCLEELKKGASLEDVLAKYPDYADEIRPLLTVANKISSQVKPQPSTNAAYNALVEAGKYMPKQKVFKPRFGFNWLINPQFVLARVVAVVLVVSLLTLTVASVSANALPGHFLYPFKLATEKIKLALTINPEGDAELRLTFSESRMQELLAIYHKKGVVDKELINAMLDEAKLALDEISALPKGKQPVFFSKVNHFNAYQKETLQSIQPHVSGQNREYIDEAIEVCSNRGKWMQKGMREGDYCSWDRSSGCDWQ
jgi:hypothetical protein